MNSSQFNALIHAPNRLQICALLTSASSMEFVVLKEQLDVSDSVLSKHIKSLEDAGYVLLNKKALNGRQRTWLSLTSSGHQAFSGHVKALKKIVG
jgi:DNA-binding MarR family transcriptional regulator